MNCCGGFLLCCLFVELFILVFDFIDVGLKYFYCQGSNLFFIVYFIVFFFVCFIYNDYDDGGDDEDGVGFNVRKNDVLILLVKRCL